MTSPDGCLVSINAVDGPDVSSLTAYNVAIRLELLQQ